MPTKEIIADVKHDKPPIRLEELGERIIETIPDGPKLDDQIALEAFLNEIVEVVVHESSDENAAEVVSVWVNGRSQHFIRGQPQKVRRCYVERLARSKQITYSQKRLKSSNDDSVTPHVSLCYPFSVTEDPNPMGSAWLKKVLAEA